MVPVADEHAVTHAAFRHRVAHVRTPVVHGVELAVFVEHRQMRAVDVERLALALLEVGGWAQWVEDEVVGVDDVLRVRQAE